MRYITIRRLLGLFIITLCLMSVGIKKSYASGYGNLITDEKINPQGLPIYDGYTKPETNTTYTVDYSRFWSIDGAMNGLGDFTNNGAKNSVSYEFARNSLSGEGTGTVRKLSDAKIVGGYWTAENRLCVALPPGALIQPSLYEPLIDDVWSNEGKYTDTSGWTKGAPALSYVKGVFDNRYLGMHVDCLLEDGTVLALIVTDTKALHKGSYKGETCKDSLLQGYGHWRGKGETKSYEGIIEVAISEDYKVNFNTNKLRDLNLYNNKIVSFRCYSETCGRFY